MLRATLLEIRSEANRMVEAIAAQRSGWLAAQLAATVIRAGAVEPRTTRTGLKPGFFGTLIS